MDDLKWHNDGLDAQRERIATAAMAAILSRRSVGGTYEDIAKSATKYADALIKELHSGD